VRTGAADRAQRAQRVQRALFLALAQRLRTAPEVAGSAPQEGWQRRVEPQPLPGRDCGKAA